MESFAGFMVCLSPLGIFSFILLLILLSNIKQVNEYEKGVLFVMGRFKKMVGPGWTFIIPIFQSMRIIDTRTKTVDLPNQETMTKDNVSIQMGVVLYYRIIDVEKAVMNVENYQWATSQLAETTMRTVVGEVELNEMLSHRDTVANKIQEIIAKVVDEWGIEIKSVELKDVVLPADMKRTMAKQAEAQREKISIIMKSEGEKQAAQNLADAAEIMSKTPGALHLRTLSTINDVSSDQSNTIMFAMPIEILRAIENFGNVMAKKTVSEDKATKK